MVLTEPNRIVSGFMRNTVSQTSIFSHQKKASTCVEAFFVFFRSCLSPLSIPSTCFLINAQIGLVVFEGTFLANRLGEESDYINLYHMGTYFAELYYDAEMNVLHNCRTFVSASQLQTYADMIDLPEL